MKLYTFDAAPNPQRLKMFMSFKGLNIDTYQVNFPEAEQRSDAYKAIVPTGTVPALVLDSGHILTSVFAITRYLESTFPEKPLLGDTAEMQAVVLDWNHRLFNDVFRATGDFFRNTSPAFAGRAVPGTLDTEQIPALAERGMSQLLHSLNVLDKELSTRPFVAGNTFTMADIDLLALLSFARWAAKVTPAEELEHLHNWHKTAKAYFEEGCTEQ